MDGFVEQPVKAAGAKHFPDVPVTGASPLIRAAPISPANKTTQSASVPRTIPPTTASLHCGEFLITDARFYAHLCLGSASWLAHGPSWRPPGLWALCLGVLTKSNTYSMHWLTALQPWFLFCYLPWSWVGKETYLGHYI